MEGDMRSGQAQKDQWRTTFDWIAPVYDQGGPGGFAHYGRRLVEVVGVRPGQRVLDIATGRGAALFPAAEIIRGDGAVVGIDLAEGMVRATTDEACDGAWWPRC